MRHGDEVQILVDGPFIRLKSLEPIGISDDSQCWGAWIERRLRPGEAEKQGCPLDFVISPIHPNLWPFAFRIEAALHNVAGTLKSLTKELVKNNVNVLFIDQSPAGYTHSVFNAVGTFDVDDELLRLFEKMELEVYNARTNATNGPERESSQSWSICKIRTKSFQELGLLMISRLVGLWANLRVAEQHLYESRDKLNEEIFFLAPRVVEQGLEPWFLRILDPDGILLKTETVDNATERKAVQRRTASVKANIKKILDVIFPHGAERKSVRALLLEMRKSHIGTRYSSLPHTNGELTSQALMARLPEDEWLINVLRRIAWRHTHLPLGVQALIRLAEMRCWMAPYEPIEFRYDAKNCLLRPAEPEKFLTQVRDLGKSGSVDSDKPVWALATFHPEDHFVRLRFLPTDTEKNRVRIDVEYHIPGHPSPDRHFAGPIHNKARSKGLLAKIAEAIFDRNGNVMRVTNSIATFDPDNGAETGRLRFDVQFESDEWTFRKSDEFREVIRDAVNEVINDRADIESKFVENTSSDSVQLKRIARDLPQRASCAIKVIPYQRQRIFISTVFSHGRIQDFRRILDEVATKHGLEPRYAEQYTQSIRMNVHNEISECAYFLQIITPRADDRYRMHTDPNFVPDFSWITYEHGCAVALQHANPNRRCIQMVDELLSDITARRIQLTQGDIAPIEFRIDDDEDTLRRHFNDAIQALIGDR